jgi:hypothetical protein
MHYQDWEDEYDYYSIMKCTECQGFVWYQDDRENLPEACHTCGNVLIAETTCRTIGYAIGGESYFYIDSGTVHEEEISLEFFESL